MPYNNTIAGKMGAIPGAVWSKALGGWHIPYNKSSFEKLLTMFPDVEYPKKEKISTQENTESKMSETAVSQEKNVTIWLIGKRILVKIPKDKNDIQFIRNIRYSRWDQKQFHWVIPNYPGNLDLIKNYFQRRIRDIVVQPVSQISIELEPSQTVNARQLLIIRTKNGRAKLIFRRDQDMILAIKRIPFHQWDASNKWWTIPMTDKFLEELKRAARMLGWEIIVRDDQSGNKTGLSRPSKSSVVNYYSTFDIKQIDEKMIISFLQYLVIERKVSESYQNQSINSIKFYYERVLGGQRKIYMVERPRRDKKLPVVLSETEVAKAIQTSEASIGAIVKKAFRDAGIKKMRRPIRFGIVLQPIFWKTEQISDTFRRCWGMRAAKQQKFTHT